MSLPQHLPRQNLPQRLNPPPPRGPVSPVRGIIPLVRPKEWRGPVSPVRGIIPLVQLKEWDGHLSAKAVPAQGARIQPVDRSVAMPVRGLRSSNAVAHRGVQVSVAVPQVEHRVHRVDQELLGALVRVVVAVAQAEGPPVPLVEAGQRASPASQSGQRGKNMKCARRQASVASAFQGVTATP